MVISGLLAAKCFTTFNGLLLILSGTREGFQNFITEKSHPAVTDNVTDKSSESETRGRLVADPNNELNDFEDSAEGKRNGPV